MPAFSSTSAVTGGLSIRRPVRAAGVAGSIGLATVVAFAAPASAHHDPEMLAAAEAAADSLDLESAAPAGLPLGLIIWSVVLVLIAAGWTRGVRIAGPSRRVIALASVGALLSIPLAATPTSAATILLPDLISDQPDPVGPVEINNYTGTDRLILRFDGYVTNVGAGPLEVSGNPQITNPLDNSGVHQRAKDTDGNWNVVGTPLVQFETADGHNHFHLMEVGRYSLWNQSQTAEAAPGQKVGFCLYDIERAEAEDYSGPQASRVYTGSVTQFCDQNNPATTDLRMGTSAGWRDVYGSYLTFQWIDVSDTSPGIYYLANEADPHNRIVESDETNNQIGFAELSSMIPGYNALPIGPTSTLGTPLDVTLASEQFGSPGSRRFEVVTPPEHGSLSVATGVEFTSSTVVYTPTAGYAGADSFEYVARDNSSDYPFNPTRAAVSIDVGELPVPSVAISGAPASLIAGTSASLTVAVNNAPAAVTWSVDGVVGGNTTVGTIGSGGLYIAPAAVPGAGSVTVRATLDADPSVFDDVTIAINPIPNTAPIVTTPAEQHSIVGDSIGLLIEANDPDGDSFTFAASGLPAGLSIHPNTGLISGIATAADTSLVTITVDDGIDTTVIDFDWVVDVRPLITPHAGALWEGDVGSKIVSIPVSLSAAVSQPVTVNWTTVGTGGQGIAVPDVDYAAASGQLTFAPGDTNAMVDITVFGDVIDEPPAWLGEWGVLAFSSPSANASIDQIFFGLGIFIIVDDD